jgi:hypothetical protein
VLAASYRITALRLTTQASPRNKFTVFWDQQRPCEGGAAQGFSGNACRVSKDGEVYAGSTAAPTPSAGALFAPETAGYRDYGNRVAQVKWTSPVSNKLLLEAGYGQYFSRYGGGQLPGLPTEDLVRVVEQCAVRCDANGGIAGLTYRSLNWFSNINWNNSWNAAASLVTGSHSIKFGYQGGALIAQSKNFGNNQFLQYRTNNGIPDQITENINRFGILQSTRFDAFYAQEQWTLGRMTLQGAVRYDHAWSYFPEQTVGPVRFFSNPVTYPRTTGVKGYNDLWPRGGVAYDLFGNGKTSVKVNFGRYLEAAQNAGFFIALNPTGRLSTTTTRAWTDANGNFVPDCDLTNSAQQGPTTAVYNGGGADFCGVNASPNFGTVVFDSTLDPGLLSGWGVRPGDWQWGASVQQEVLPRVAVEFGFQRRWLVNSNVIDNRARSPQDHTKFGLTIPTDSRLPGNGGGILEALYNVTPEAAARLNDNYETLATTYADWTRLSNSVNLNVTARMRSGVMLQGGFNSGTTTSDYCDVRAAIPEWNIAPPTITTQSPTNPWCDTSTGWVTRLTALGSYTVPKIDVQVSGTFRSDPGGQLAANYTAPNSATVGLNRPFAGLGGQTITVNLIEPGTLYGQRVNQVDMRFAKVLRLKGTKTLVGFDVYNLSNSAAVLTYNQTFSPTSTTWLRPTSVLQARFVKVSAQIDF